MNTIASGNKMNALGRRVSTTDASGTVYHAYDGIHCVADLAADGTLLRSYTWGSGIDNLLAVTLYDGDSTNTLYAVTDPLGTVHALVDTNGAVAVTYAYDSWGNLTADATSASLPNRFTWQGREYSHATGLYSFRARWYDPSAGRWLSKDPIGLEGGLNLYEAFGNNPVCFVDPYGLSFWGSFGRGLIDGITSAVTAAVIVTVVVAVVSVVVPVVTPVASCALTSALLTVGIGGAINTATSIYNDPSGDNIGYEMGKICGGTIVGLCPGQYTAQVISPVGNKPSAAGIVSSLKKDPSQIFIPQKGQGLLQGISDCMSKGPTVGGAAMAIGICPIPNPKSCEETCR